MYIYSDITKYRAVYLKLYPLFGGVRYSECSICRKFVVYLQKNVHFSMSNHRNLEI